MRVRTSGQSYRTITIALYHSLSQMIVCVTTCQVLLCDVFWAGPDHGPPGP